MYNIFTRAREPGTSHFGQVDDTEEDSFVGEEKGWIFALCTEADWMTPKFAVLHRYSSPNQKREDYVQQKRFEIRDYRL